MNTARNNTTLASLLAALFLTFTSFAGGGGFDVFEEGEAFMEAQTARLGIEYWSLELQNSEGGVLEQWTGLPDPTVHLIEVTDVAPLPYIAVLIASDGLGQPLFDAVEDADLTDGHEAIQFALLLAERELRSLRIPSDVLPDMPREGTVRARFEQPDGSGSWGTGTFDEDGNIGFEDVPILRGVNLTRVVLSDGNGSVLGVLSGAISTRYDTGAIDLDDLRVEEDRSEVEATARYEYLRLLENGIANYIESDGTIEYNDIPVKAGHLYQVYCPSAWNYMDIDLPEWGYGFVNDGPQKFFFVRKDGVADIEVSGTAGDAILIQVTDLGIQTPINIWSNYSGPKQAVAGIDDIEGVVLSLHNHGIDDIMITGVELEYTGQNSAGLTVAWFWDGTQQGAAKSLLSDNGFMDFDDLFVPASTWSPVDIGLVIDSVEAHAGGNVTFRVSQVRGYNISTGQPVTSLYSVTSRELSFIESGEVVARTGDFVQGGEISVGDQNVELMQINFFAENDEVQVTDLGFGVEGEGDAAALDIGLFNSSGQLLQMAIPHNGYLTYDLASFDRIRVPEGGSDFVTVEALKMFDGFTDGDIRLRLNTLEAVTAATGNDLQPGFITVDDVVSETFTLSDPTP